MITNLSDFISQSLAEKTGEKWTVYCDGENKLGAILNVRGGTEFEAKENAWEYYNELVNATEKYRNKNNNNDT